MQRTTITVVTAAFVGALAAAGLFFLLGRGSAGGSRDTGQQLAAIEDDLDGLRGELRKDVQVLEEKIAVLEDGHDELARITHGLKTSADAGDAGAETAAKAPTAAGDPPATSSPEFRNQVMALFREPELKDQFFSLIREERDVQREEMRKREEEFRKLREEMSNGPYEQFNLKVNSMARAVTMNDAQKQQYFEIMKKNYTELGDLRQKTNWGDREARDAYRTAQDKIQQNYASAVEAILTPEQFDVYQKLPDWSRSLMNTNFVPAAGEETSPFMRFRGAPNQGGGPGGPAQMRGGGRQGNRGNRGGGGPPGGGGQAGGGQ
jgi:hypothetical protein